MGGGSYSDRAWSDFKTSRGYDKKSTTIDDIYKSKDIVDELNPLKFGMRESIDSEDNPNSTPIIIGLDVTGSMDSVLDVMARDGLKTVCKEVYERKPVSDPHICVLGIGDVECDSAPFQATQFEADIRIFEQLEKLYLERGGGGNSFESYILAWYFAKFRTKTDSFAKRGKKGFIFTIGDEEITRRLTSKQIKRFMGDAQAPDFNPQSLLDAVYNEWNVFHVIVKETYNARRNFPVIKKSWDDVIGSQRVIPLDDHTALGETIVSVIELAAGREVRDVVDSWDGSKSVAIANAISAVSTTDTTALDAVI